MKFIETLKNLVMSIFNKKSKSNCCNPLGCQCETAPTVELKAEVKAEVKAEEVKPKSTVKKRVSPTAPKKSEKGPKK